MPSPAKYQAQNPPASNVVSGPTPFMKSCPRCDSVLFADSDRCYECLYDYNNPNLDYSGSGSSETVPDEFDLEEPVPIDAYSQDYPAFESDVREEPYKEPYRSNGSAAAVSEERAPRAVVAGEAETIPDAVEDGSSEAGDSGQDAGLFAEPSDPVREGQSNPSQSSDIKVQLGVLVHWRGMEMTTALGDGELTIGRDRANDLTISSFDVPAFAAAIELSDDGADFTLLAEGVEAELDGSPIAETVHLGAGQEIALYGARLSLVRLD